MADVHDKKARSFNMSQIKSKNTKPELLVRKFLFSKGFRYKLHDSKLPGKPDIVLPKYKTVVFVNGCFWHGHKNCKYFKFPKTRTKWWKAKIEKTRKKDVDVSKKLLIAGWQVINIWECQLKKKSIKKTLNKLPNKIVT